MSIKNQTFISKAQHIHGDTYDYSCVDYVNIRTPVNIICKKHGPFLQTPNAHLSKRSGCPTCSKKRYMNKEVFVQRANEIHNYQYDYSLIEEYIGYDTEYSIICKIHGVFKQSARNHILSKHGCPSCVPGKLKQRGIARRLTTEEFIKRAREVHGEVYCYDKVACEGTNKKVEIVCKIHGSFMMTPQSHCVQKSKCPKCSRKNSAGKGGYHEGFFQKHPGRKNTPALLYVVEMACETDNFIKVGITIKNIEKRYQRRKSNLKQVQKKTIAIHYMSLYDAYKLEQRILQELKHYQYFPNYVIDGKTECLKNNPDVLQQINTIIQESVRIIG